MQSIEQITEVMERDLERLRATRPYLASRIERAEHILVTQLSVTNGHRPIKARIGADGSHSYTVRSGSKLAKSYAVSPKTWTCECPDHRKRLASTLWRAGYWRGPVSPLRPLSVSAPARAKGSLTGSS